MINVDIKNSIEGYFVPSDFKNELIRVLDILGAEKVNVELEFVSPETIRDMNYKSRNIDKPTDVLSFPLSQFDIPRNLLGSIVICPEIVKEKSENIYSVLRHGGMHLMGFDHETDQRLWDSTAKKVGEVL